MKHLRSNVFRPALAQRAKHVIGAMLVLWSLACATVFIDYPVDVNLPLRVSTTQGQPLEGVAVAFADGLADRELAVTGPDGRAVLRHMFLWGHKKGAAPSPPRFTLKLTRSECAPLVLEQTVKSQQSPPEELRIEMACPNLAAR